LGGGDILLIITDINGNTEALSGYKSLKRYRNVSGEKTLAFFILPTENNAHSFPMVQEESIVEFDGEPYRVKQVSEKPKGPTFYKEVIAVHTFFDLIDEHVYELHNGSLTFDDALQFVLGGSGYTWVIIGSFYAQSWENFGDDNRLALLQDVLTRYGAEFTLNGTQITFRQRIGNATDFQFRYNYNVKTLERNVNTHNLSTYIKGFGKKNEDGTYAIESEYTSPNAAVFGIRHAKPVRDERYTTIEGLDERLQAELIDSPEISLTIDFADLRRAGYPYDVPGEGDDVFLIYEPMNVDVEARLMEIDEEFTEANALPIKTLVTLANIRENMTDKLVNTQKDVKDIVEGKTKLPYSALDDAVKRATEALQSAQTELEFENGIIARSKINPNHLVVFNSAGVGVSLDGGFTFRTAMTADGFVADLVTVGTMLADRIKGGQFTLGGADNGNGRMVVLDANGDVIADLDAEKGGFSDLYVANLTSPTVVSYAEDFNATYYVSTVPVDGFGVTPSDANTGLGWDSPLATIAGALKKIPIHFNGTVTIRLAGGLRYYTNINIQGFTGGGAIIIDGVDKTNTVLVGAITVTRNTVNVRFSNLTIQTTKPDVAISYTSSNGSILNCIVYGLSSSGTTLGIAAYQGSALEVSNTEVYDVAVCVSSRNNCSIFIDTCKGYGATCGIHAYGGYITGRISSPTGATQQLLEAGGQVFVTFAPDSGAYVLPTPAETTKTIATSSGNNWSTSGWWGNDGVKQGNYGYGRRTGLWFFGANILNTIGNGKTIKAVRVYIQRTNSGGTSGGVRHSLRAHGYQTQPAGAPSVSAEIGFATLKWGQGAWITVSPSFFDGIANGTYRGFGIYVDSDSSSLYSICSTSCTVEITYS
jgi:phage minor structural protein